MDKHRTYTSVKLNKVLKERAPTLEIMVVLVQCGQVADPLHARLLPSWLAGWPAARGCLLHPPLPPNSHTPPPRYPATLWVWKLYLQSPSVTGHKSLSAHHSVGRSAGRGNNPKIRFAGNKRKKLAPSKVKLKCVGLSK